ncbi:complement regulator-acquiring protein (plasmid) [Borrelia anserina]|uniref:Antigen P35 n=1 Tax=Borrelia anserina Es TaxID=1365188 RepID=A0ABM6FVL9_BORAN|nr:complement regulator-acquiring protein [Borrelia anserina]APR65329.1 hypothetical protein N187_A10 [Borrelia anserina Es]UPA07297.1 complement regulator-acquiring protein [Borrelia anserina]
MRNNITNKIFSIFALTASILLSCNPYPLDHINLKTNETQSNDTTKLKNINTNPQLSNISDKNAKQAQDQSRKSQEIESEVDKTALINEIISKAQTNLASIKKYNNNTEDPEQYGMKWGAFKILTNKDNKETINSNQNTHMRKKFYSSLEWKEERIKKLGKIINIISKTNTSELAKILILTGTNYAYIRFEWGMEIINRKKDNLKTLTLTKLKEIKSNINQIEQLKQKWIDTIDKLIAEYEDNTNEIQNNNQELINYINSQYRTILETELPNIQTLANNIQNILK